MYKSKRCFLYTFIIFLLTASVSTGFDYYSHATSYYYYDQILNYSDLLFKSVVLPRYLLLSYIYEWGSRIGIPAGYTVLLLNFIPVWSIIKTINKKNQNYYTLFDVIGICCFFILSLFYSGLSVSLLWLLAFLVTKKRYLLIGSLFHPISVFMFIVATFFLARRYLFNLILLLVSFFYFLYISTQLDLFTASKYYFIRYSLSDFNDLVQLIEISFEKKMNEFVFLICMISFILPFKKRIESYLGSETNNDSSILTSIKIPSQLVDLFFVFFTAVFVLYMFGRPNLLTALFTFDLNEVIYLTWFDFGEKNINMNYWDLYKQRYW